MTRGRPPQPRARVRPPSTSRARAAPAASGRRTFRVLERGDVPDRTTALAVHLDIAAGARNGRAGGAAQRPPQRLIFSGADHGDVEGEELAKREVETAISHVPPSSRLVIDEFSGDAHTRMEPPHRVYLTESEPILRPLVQAYKLESSGNTAQARTAMRVAHQVLSDTFRRARRDELVAFMTGRDGLSPQLLRMHEQALSIAKRLRVPQRRIAEMHAHLLADARRELARGRRTRKRISLRRGNGQDDRGEEGGEEAAFTESCGLWLASPLVSLVFAAFRAALDVKTYLHMRLAIHEGVAVTALHAGRSHLKNVLTLFQAFPPKLQCNVNTNRGFGVCRFGAVGAGEMISEASNYHRL